MYNVQCKEITRQNKTLLITFLIKNPGINLLFPPTLGLHGPFLVFFRHPWTISCFFLGIHADDTPEARALKHVVKSLVNFRKRDFMSDEFLQLKLLFRFTNSKDKRVCMTIDLPIIKFWVHDKAS